jgi:thiamine pyrophosphate-dependent acetolactate synthase large subunit-like protein
VDAGAREARRHDHHPVEPALRHPRWRACQVGAGAPGKTARDLFDLGNPDLDWVRLANGFGVEGAKADTMEKLADLMTFANRRAGPFLIELAIS